MSGLARTEETPRQADAPPALARAAPVFVWGVWSATALAALVCVGRYGSRIPFWDDWTLVPFVTGDREVSPAWLWEQHNEHRVPLPKLLLVGLYRLTDYDFRAGMFVSALALAGLAFLLIRTARRVRGRTSYADAFFPLVLLHWGHYESFLISFAVNLVLPAALAGVVLCLLVRARDRLPFGSAVLAGACLVLLPLCSASGVALVPALALWLGYAGVLRWKSCEPHARRNGLVILGLAAAALALVPLVFVGYKRPYFVYDPSALSPRDYARTGLQVLSMGFGLTDRRLWPYSGLVVVGVVTLSLALLARGWRARPGERFRALGLLAFVAAMLSLTAGIGWGRSVQGHYAGFQSRFVTLAVPLFCGVYFIADLYSPAAVRGVARAALFGLACLALPWNTGEGLRYAESYRRQVDAFERDLRAGEPTYLLLARYSSFLFFSQNEELAEAMKMLHRAGAGPFRSLQPDPAFDEVFVPLEPAALNDMTWEGGTGRGAGADPSALFRVPPPRFVAGVRIRYCYPDADCTPLYFQVFWRRSDRDDFGQDRRYLNFLLERSAEERELTVWLADTIDEFRIHPDNKSGAFRVSGIVLLVPQDSGRPR